jgi:hypothetical protein
LHAVKQQIARQCIIPFYKFFGRDAPHFKTPDGALILHWVFAVLWLIATPNTSDGYGFLIGLFIYGQLVVGGKHSDIRDLQCLQHTQEQPELIFST